MPVFAAGGQTGQVSGSVIDTATKAPVVGARVTAASPSGVYHTTTDGAGRFSILGMTVDSYNLTVEAQGYDAFQSSGVTVTGDQTITLGTLSLSKTLKTIGRTTSRSAAGAFQPGQTTDSYTVSGARIGEALGNAGNTNENTLLLSVPGASTTDSGRVTIRGGLSNEVGFQLDGVPFTEPFFSTNASNNRLNGISSLQVVEGAGDATQGNIGSGVVNTIPRRGSYPGTGLVDVEVGSPNYFHQVSANYGIATRTGNVSNFISYVGNRGAPYYGYYNQNVAFLGNGVYRAGTTLETNDDLLDNFVVRFGKANRQSLQVLYDTRDTQDYGQVGGLAARQYYLTDPYVYTHGIVGNPFAGLLGPDDTGVAGFQAFTGLTPYANVNQNTSLTNASLVGTAPTQYLKFEYDNNLDDKTFLAARYYNLTSLSTSNATYTSSANPVFSSQGGQRVGETLELTRNLGPHTVTVQAQLENTKPRWNDYAPLESYDFFGADGLQLNDFLPAAYNGGATGVDAGVNGWVYSHLGNTRLPTVGINYNQADFQSEGIGLRDQWAIGDKLKVDYGVRVDHENYKYGSNAALNPDLGNFSDVDPSFIRNDVLHPTEFQPRLAFSYLATRNDSIRVSYGRSVEFLNAQGAGTPGGIYGGDALASVPVLPGTNTANPASWTCGSGFNSSRLIGGSPTAANASGKGGGYFRCANYLQQYYWAYDQNNDAPDIGNGTSPTYDNYDLSYSHEFKSGFGFRATGFTRRASGLPSFFVLTQKNDPVTGEILYQVFSVNNNAISKTTGLELNLTTPERPVGFSGFISATYQNAISSVPPLLPSEDDLPLITAQSLQLGDLYRAGFLSPFVASVGGTYRTKGGLRITPDVRFNAGYPTGIGQNIAYDGFINGAAVNVKQTNLGNSSPTAVGFNGSTGAGVATQYIDPAYPGSVLNPNIAATRGTKEGGNPGSVLTNPSFIADLTVEYTIGKRNTIGLQIQNLFGSVYFGNTPQSNTYYQPVTTGVAGPATGIPSSANPLQTSYANHGYAVLPSSSYGTNPYLLLPNQPTTYRVYYQLGL